MIHENLTEDAILTQFTGLRLRFAATTSALMPPMTVDGEKLLVVERAISLYIIGRLDGLSHKRAVALGERFIMTEGRR